MIGLTSEEIKPVESEFILQQTTVLAVGAGPTGLLLG